MVKRSSSPREVAEIVAIQALSFLASRPDQLGQFLSETGIGPQTLRSSASDPVFLAGDIHDLAWPGREGQADTRGDAALANVVESRSEGRVLDMSVRCHSTGIGRDAVGLKSRGAGSVPCLDDGFSSRGKARQPGQRNSWSSSMRKAWQPVQRSA